MGIRTHQLNKPIYQRTAAYGHFGRKPEQDGGLVGKKLIWLMNLKPNVSRKNTTCSKILDRTCLCVVKIIVIKMERNGETSMAVLRVKV